MEKKEMPVAAMEPPVVATPMNPTRPFYWSVRRELWENRSIVIAPLVAGAAIVLGFIVSMLDLSGPKAAGWLRGAVATAGLGTPYDTAAMVMILAGFLVGAFYCLDALHGEHRDRSILFWKSLPVSDRTAVLSKASIPLLVLPLVIFVATVATQLVMILLGTAALAIRGDGGWAASDWGVPEQSVILLYGLIALALWHAPIYGWLLLVSAFARRTAFLWAVFPPLAVGVVEYGAFGTSDFGSMLRERAFGQAFAANAQGMANSLSQLTPGTFLATPGLWIGLAFTAACLAAAVRLRRDREPA
jgi:ABC-2 type transport system permease protein